MLEDFFGHPISTSNTQARDAYVHGVDLFLAANVGAEESLIEATQADPGFALGHIALARTLQSRARPADAKAAAETATQLAGNVTPREASQINIISLLVQGRSPEAYALARPHLVEHPTDVMVAQTCTGVFGLIGFSGLPGREAEHLALTTWLAPHYGDHWWFLTQHAFAQMESGQLAPAHDTIERALVGNLRNGNAAHYRAHLYYENAETEQGFEFLTEWMKDYDKRAPLHCHMSWHRALWALAADDVDTMWGIFEAHVSPDGAWGPPLNILTDTVALLYRAGLRGVEVTPERWQQISAFAKDKFPNPGIAFADTHAALAHAVVGEKAALETIRQGAKGAAAEVVRTLADAFTALGEEDWRSAIEHLTVAMRDHARIGGSRAQRDLVEFSMANALVSSGATEEARRLLSLRRPLIPLEIGPLGL